MRRTRVLSALTLGLLTVNALAQAGTVPPNPGDVPGGPPAASRTGTKIGFDLRNVVVFAPVWRTAKPNEDMWKLIEQLRQSPDVAGAAGVFPPPFMGIWPARIYNVESYRPIEPNDCKVNAMWVTDGFFETVGTPLLKGRLFDPNDRNAATHAAIVNESFARHFLGAGSPLGKHVECEFPGGDASVGQKTRLEIVGVVANARYADLRQPAVPMLFFSPSSVKAGFCIVRTRGDAGPLIDRLPSLVRQIGPAAEELNITRLERLPAKAPQNKGTGD